MHWTQARLVTDLFTPSSKSPQKSFLLKRQHVLAMLIKTKEAEKTSRQSYEQIGFWRQL